jgi:hypothetical protein
MSATCLRAIADAAWAASQARLVQARRGREVGRPEPPHAGARVDAVRLLAIDPGSERSGFVVYRPPAALLVTPAGPVLQPAAILEHGVESNEELMARCWRQRDDGEQHHLAIAPCSAPARDDEVRAVTTEMFAIALGQMLALLEHPRSAP